MSINTCVGSLLLLRKGQHGGVHLQSQSWGAEDLEPGQRLEDTWGLLAVKRSLFVSSRFSETLNLAQKVWGRETETFDTHF